MAIIQKMSLPLMRKVGAMALPFPKSLWLSLLLEGDVDNLLDTHFRGARQVDETMYSLPPESGDLFS